MTNPSTVSEFEEHWQEWQRCHLRQTVLILSCTDVALQCLGLWMDHAILPLAVGQEVMFWRAIHTANALVVGLLILLIGKQAKFRTLLAAAVAFCGPAAAFVWYAQSAYLESGFAFGSISGFHMLPMILAAANWGKPWLGFGFVTAAAVETLAFWHHFGLSERVRPVMYSEPLNTIAFFVTAYAICYLRYITALTTRDLLLARTQILALSQINKMLLGLRDQANSPLQTLELGLAVYPECEPSEIVLAMRSAVHRLRQLHAALANTNELNNGPGPLKGGIR